MILMMVLLSRLGDRVMLSRFGDTVTKDDRM